MASSLDSPLGGAGATIGTGTRATGSSTVGATAGSISASSAPTSSSSGASSSSGTSSSSTGSSGGDSLEAAVDAIERDYASRLAQVTELFAERERRRAKRDIPDHFVCSITFEVMRDPVITPSGTSYERETIEHYLSTVKPEDPVTRKPLTKAQLYPNLGLKAAIDAWLAENPWAHPLLPADAASGSGSSGGGGRSS